MKLSIGSDHAGFEYKSRLIQFLESKGHKVNDKGCYSNESVDYPDYAHLVASDIEQGNADLGIVICGSGNGVNITVNKHPQVRSALCWMPEIASLARQHNDANIIALPARFVAYELAEEMVQVFLETAFEGGRHQRRVDKISC